MADLTNAWLTYALDRDLLAIAEDTAANAAKAVDLTRFENGAVPVLNSHQQWDLQSQIGTTLPGTARFEGSSLILGTKLSARDEVAGIVPLGAV